MADTIFAQATTPGRAGIAVVRISGPRAFEASVALGAAPGAARGARLRWLVDPASGERQPFTEIALYTVRGGQITEERYFYD